MVSQSGGTDSRDNDIEIRVNIINIDQETKSHKLDKPRRAAQIISEERETQYYTCNLQ